MVGEDMRWWWQAAPREESVDVAKALEVRDHAQKKLDEAKVSLDESRSIGQRMAEIRADNHFREIVERSFGIGS